MCAIALTLRHRVQVVLVPRLINQRPQLALRILEQDFGSVEFDL
jgi:hypothetical protein